MDEGDPECRVLCVAEKPSVARAIAEALSGGKHCTRNKNSPLQVHLTYAYFPPAKRRCSVAITSVVGHVFGLDFAAGAEKRGDITSIFQAKTRKVVEETSERLGVVQHLQAQAEGCGWLCLWLDCDREGENICFEVLNVLPQFSAERVWRAKFSAVTEREVRGAWSHLDKPNAAEAAAVDARQELDLKVGVSFTRLLTRALRDAARRRFSMPTLRLLSYGPCQTPALWFVVQRHTEIEAFVPQHFWELAALVSVGERGQEACHHTLGWVCNPCFDERKARRAASAVRAARQLEIVSTCVTRRTYPPPVGLNTVALLKLASCALGLSPHRAMQIAEELYTSGLISYPRTESTRYPLSFDVGAALAGHEHSQEWGPIVRWLQLDTHRAPPRGGNDVGDHPPITPMRYSHRGGVRGGPAAWALYSAIVKHFVASLLPAASADEHVLSASSAGERFETTWHRVHERGWLHALPHRAHGLGIEASAPGVLDGLGRGAVLPLVRLEESDSWTCPPDLLRESELIEAMDKHGVGTDASMAQHVATIVERGYCRVVGADGQPLGEEGLGVGGKGGKGGKERGGGGGGKGSKGKGKGGGVQGSGGKGGGVRSGTDSEGGGGGGGGRFMVPSDIGLALVRGLGAVDAQLVRPELRGSMEALVTRIASGLAQKGEVVSGGLATFRQQFDKLRRSMHLLVPYFGELGQTDREGEGGEDELIRLELIAASGKQTLAEWKRARDLEEQLEVAADVADASERERRHRDRELSSAIEGAGASGSGGGATAAVSEVTVVDEAQSLLRALFTPSRDAADEEMHTVEESAAALFERTAVAAAAAAARGRGGKGRGRGAATAKGGRGGASAAQAAAAAASKPSLSEWLATHAPASDAVRERPEGGGRWSAERDVSEQEGGGPLLRGRAKARADAAMADAADAAERERIVRERQEALAARPAKSVAEELARSLFTAGGDVGVGTSETAVASSMRLGGGGGGGGGGGRAVGGYVGGGGGGSDRRASSMASPGGGTERGSKGGGGHEHGSNGGGGKGGGAKGGGGKGSGGKGGRGGGGGGVGKGGGRAAAAPPPAAPLSRWEQMEAERAARVAADGGRRTAFAGGLASTHGLTEAEREQRDAAQRKIKKALSTPEARAKVLADPKKLPTVKAGERWICQWEQLGLPCAPLGSEHFERNAHKVCAYCLVIGHPLVRCELATKDGVDVAGINAVAGSPQGGLARGAGGAGKRRT